MSLYVAIPTILILIGLVVALVLSSDKKREEAREANEKLQELQGANKKLRDANEKLQEANDELRDANEKLQEANREILVAYRGVSRGLLKDLLGEPWEALLSYEGIPSDMALTIQRKLDGMAIAFLRDLAAHIELESRLGKPFGRGIFEEFIKALGKSAEETLVKRLNALFERKKGQLHTALDGFPPELCRYFLDKLLGPL